MLRSKLKRFLGVLFTDPPPSDVDLDSPVSVARLQRAKTAFLELARPAVALEARTSESVPDGPSSSIGGRPSLPAGMDWPTCRQGKPMLFLAQISYGDMPALDGYPAGGVLSFFVPDDGLKGLRFKAGKPTGEQVLWFEEGIDLERRAAPDLRWRNDVYGTELRRQGAPLVGRTYTAFPSVTCSEFDAVADQHFSENEEKEAFLEWVLTLDSPPMHYGGYPDFAQTDLRTGSEGSALSSVMLQLDSIYEVERPWRIEWGDAGKATFLLTQADLEGRRFGGVVYGWDCH